MNNTINHMNKITYVFGNGREKKLNNNVNYSSDFLYGFDYFLENDYQVNYIVASESKNKTLIFIEKVLRKITKLPFYMSNYISIKNIKIIFSSKVLILSNDPIALSLLPILVFYKIFRRGKIIVIVMGLLSKPKPNNAVKNLQRLIINFLLLISTYFIFLGMNEKQNAEIKFPKHNKKLKYIPFCIDTKFWKKVNIEKKYDLIFVGNDGNRDYIFLIDLLENLKDYKFLVISDNQILKNYFKKNKLPNVEFREGNLSSSAITDLKLKKLYNSSKISIVPLKDTLQPSGQSVSLQSLASGLPVLISETKGNWFDGEKIDSKFLYSIKSNDVALWNEKINFIFDNIVNYQNLSSDIENFIVKNLDKIYFDQTLESLIFNEFSKN